MHGNMVLLGIQEQAHLSEKLTAQMDIHTSQGLLVRWVAIDAKLTHAFTLVWVMNFS